MKFLIIAKLAAAALCAGCASSDQLENRIQTFNLVEAVSKPTVVLAPKQAVEFSAFATKESASVEREIRGSFSDAMKQFGRLQAGTPTGSDATFTIDAVRHGVTSAGDNFYAPIVEVDLHATGMKGEMLLRRSHSATSGEVNTLEQFIKDPALYRQAIAVAAQKLALELAGGL